MSKSKAALRAWLLSGELPRPCDAEEADAIAEAARQQGLAGLLLDALCDAPWPATTRANLRTSRRAALVRGVRQLDAASRVQRALAAEGLRALPIKGAAIADSLYGTVADRPMADVDVLALDDWTASTRCLEQAGFGEIGRASHAWAYVDPPTGAVVELHCAFTSCPDLHPVDGEGLWRRSRTSGSPHLRVPSPEDLLVHLCLHGAFQHGLVLSLVQYLDIRRVFERSKLDLSTLTAAAAVARAEASVAVCLEAAAVVVGAPVPRAVKDAFVPHLPRSLRRWLDERLANPLCFVAPEPAALARVRWGLCAGRRRALLAATFAVPEVSSREPFLHRSWRVLARSEALARRWALPWLRGDLAPAREGATGKRTRVWN
jgi:hypothetical protein